MDVDNVGLYINTSHENEDRFSRRDDCQTGNRQGSIQRNLQSDDDQRSRCTRLAIITLKFIVITFLVFIWLAVQCLIGYLQMRYAPIPNVDTTDDQPISNLFVETFLHGFFIVFFTILLGLTINCLVGSIRRRCDRNVNTSTVSVGNSLGISQVLESGNRLQNSTNYNMLRENH